jgi:hypothetical protein
VRFPKLRLTGECDAVVKDAEGPKWVVEVKTINPFEFGKLQEPKQVAPRPQELRGKLAPSPKVLRKQPPVRPLLPLANQVPRQHLGPPRRKRLRRLTPGRITIRLQRHRRRENQPRERLLSESGRRSGCH